MEEYYIELPVIKGCPCKDCFKVAFSYQCDLRNYLDSLSEANDRPVWYKAVLNEIILKKPETAQEALQVCNDCKAKAEGTCDRSFRLSFISVTQKCAGKGGFNKQYVTGCPLNKYINSGKSKYQLNTLGGSLVPGHSSDLNGLQEALREVRKIKQICAKCRQEKTMFVR